MRPQAEHAKGWTGVWRSSAPMDVAQIDEDAPILDALVIPDGMIVSRMEVWVHGRLWEWEKIDWTGYS